MYIYSQHHRRRRPKYVFPQPVGPVTIAVSGCWKRNSFPSSLVVVVAEVAASDILDCLYVCIGDGGGGGGRGGYPRLPICLY
jgi:hypothetical protein